MRQQLLFHMLPTSNSCYFILLNFVSQRILKLQIIQLSFYLTPPQIPELGE